MQSRLNNRFSSNLFLLIISLIIACVIWMIAKSNDRGQQRFRVPLLLVNRPADVVIRPLIDAVEVGAAFPKSMQIYIGYNNFQAIIDWNDLPDMRWCGVEEYGRSQPLEIKEIRPSPGISDELRSRMEREITFSGIQPSKMPLEAKYITRPVNIAFAAEGKPAEGYTQTGQIVPTIKRTVLLTASPERFSELGAGDENASVTIRAEPVELSGRKESFAETVRLQVPENTKLVYEEDQRIEVQVPVGEIIERINIANVPVSIRTSDPNIVVDYAEKTATLTVQAPRRFLRILKPGDFIIHPDRYPPEQPGSSTSATLRGFIANATLSSEIINSVEIISVRPSAITLSHRWRNPAASPTIAPFNPSWGNLVPGISPQQ